MRKVNVIGVGMTKFTTPKALVPYTQMGTEAVKDALKDAGIDYSEIEQAYAGYVYGDSCSGERVLYDVGVTGIPIMMVLLMKKREFMQIPIDVEEILNINRVV